MSIEQANAFRAFVSENKSVQQQIKASAEPAQQWGPGEDFDLVAVAAEHGYEFTEDEAKTAWGEAEEDNPTDVVLSVLSYIIRGIEPDEWF